MTRRGKVLSVSPSPLNTVKLDLAVVLCLGLLLWLIQGLLGTGTVAQIVILAGYGIAGMAWIMLRIYRVLHAMSAHETGATAATCATRRPQNTPEAGD
ncbi:MAG: hypothetical protein KGJ12_01315 [Gammaproteobacteria bacterium]|nr:hypothetical protein [Gammaproteobacteria bacterium]